MKRLIMMMLAVIATATSVYAQNIKLPSPQKNGGLPINQTLAERHSEREFNSGKPISLQTVSDLLWAACGINRTDNGQDFVLDAPASIVLVADTTKAGLNCSLIDAGIACENIILFCTGNGLATVPRMTMDVKGIQQLLSLPETSLPVMNNPVGYSK